MFMWPPQSLRRVHCRRFPATLGSQILIPFGEPKFNLICRRSFKGGKKLPYVEFMPVILSVTSAPKLLNFFFNSIWENLIESCWAASGLIYTKNLIHLNS
jgi:hypothetical protein